MAEQVYQNGSSEIPFINQMAVLSQSEPMPEHSVPVRGYDFSSGVDYHMLLQSFKTTGFQATHFGMAVEELNRMLVCRGGAVPEGAIKESLLDEGCRPVTNCTVFLGYTSNLISAGTRETIRYLVKNNMVDCIVTTAGGVEEDFIKCLADTYLGDFHLSGRELRKKGINRTGNLLVPNENYCKFEDWLKPILATMLEEQLKNEISWTPSKFISRLGKEINNPDSVYYWAYQNNIPVFCPALTDGSIGDVLYFTSYSNPGLKLDIVEDVRLINRVASRSVNSGMFILGGGVVKHHICNANLMRNGADFSVFVNTASEFDGSDSGARPDEAISWGKIRPTANPVKVYGEATIIFPLLVAETFARNYKPPPGMVPAKSS